MLYMLGPIAFEVWPYNTHEVSHDAKTDYAAKDVLGARRPNEYVGEGDETIKLSGRMLPEKVAGALEMHDMMQGIRQSGQAQFLLRGDGTPLGWFVIESVSTRSKHLNGSGVGQFIEFDILLKRDDPPQAAGAFAMLAGIFG